METKKGTVIDFVIKNPNIYTIREIADRTSVNYETVRHAVEYAGLSDKVKQTKRGPKRKEYRDTGVIRKRIDCRGKHSINLPDCIAHQLQGHDFKWQIVGGVVTISPIQ